MARVLHIEDDKECREIVSCKLKGHLQIDEANTLADGIVMAHRIQYDGILLDPGLVDADRETALNRIKAAVEGVAIIILTGYDDEAWTRRQISSNASGVLLKGRDDREALPFASQIIRAISVHRACAAIDAAQLQG
jgi:DNA-binding response OmpR family regulator